MNFKIGQEIKICRRNGRVNKAIIENLNEQKLFVVWNENGYKFSKTIAYSQILENITANSFQSNSSLTSFNHRQYLKSYIQILLVICIFILFTKGVNHEYNRSLKVTFIIYIINSYYFKKL